VARCTCYAVNNESTGQGLRDLVVNQMEMGRRAGGLGGLLPCTQPHRESGKNNTIRYHARLRRTFVRTTKLPEADHAKV
jgi:hypothetical protein